MEQPIPLDPASSAEQPRYLFIHEDSTTFLRKVKRTVNQPTPLPSNPMLEQQHPWEQGSVSNYGTVIFDPAQKKYRYWYLVTPGKSGTVKMGGRELPANRTMLCYAESVDGLKWEKPSLGQVDFNGSNENNLLSIGRLNVEGAAILYDPKDPDPARRYKAFYWEHGGTEPRKGADGQLTWADSDTDGIWVSFSPDGIRWTNHPDNPVIRCGSDTSHSVVRDPATGRYVAFGRFGFGRVVARTESADCLKWSRPELVLEPDDHEASGAYPDTQFYGMTVSIYEGLYLGGLWLYRPGSDGAIETQLTCSRDGIHWQRVADRAPLLSLKTHGRPLDGMIRTSPNFITSGDRVLVYYGLVSGPHAGPKFPKETIVRSKPTQICQATLRRDGFVSLDAGDEPGVALTKPFPMNGKSLHINLHVKDAGEASISLCSQTPDPVAEIARSEIIRPGDYSNHIVRWPELDWPKQAGETRRLRFQLRNASLYSFWPA